MWSVCNSTENSRMFYSLLWNDSWNSEWLLIFDLSRTNTTVALAVSHLSTVSKRYASMTTLNKWVSFLKEINCLCLFWKQFCKQILLILKNDKNHLKNKIHIDKYVAYRNPNWSVQDRWLCGAALAPFPLHPSALHGTPLAPLRQIGYEWCTTIVTITLRSITIKLVLLYNILDTYFNSAVAYDDISFQRFCRTRATPWRAWSPSGMQRSRWRGTVVNRYCFTISQ